MSEFTGVMNRYILPFSGVVLFFAIIFAGIKIIQNASKARERASYIYSLGYIAIGAAILSLLVPISNMIYVIYGISMVYL